MLNKIRSHVDRRLVAELALAMILVLVVFFSAQAGASPQSKVFYSLDQRQNDLEIVKLINAADDYVYFAIYYFTRDSIAEALIRAKERGVVVWGITDRAASLESNKKILEKLRSAGLTVETQRHQDGIMHVKALVTEKAYASGSYNWTDAATEANDEVLEIGFNRDLHGQYLAIIKKILLKNQ